MKQLKSLNLRKLIIWGPILLTAVSCDNMDEIKTSEEKPKPSFVGYIENSNLTKTNLLENGQGQGVVLWNPSDKINVFFGTRSIQYISQNTKDETNTVFETTQDVEDIEPASSSVLALYPFDSEATCDETSIMTTLMCQQKGVSGSFDINSFPIIARSDNDELHFRNVCGGIRFTLSRDDVQSITFRGNGDEDIAGKVRLTIDENECPVTTFVSGENTITIIPKEGETFESGANYCIILPPCELSKGFTMTFSVSEFLTGTFNCTEPTSISRAVFGMKADIDTFATFVDNRRTTPFTLTSTGESTVSLVKVGNPKAIELEYHVGKNDWTAYSVDTEIIVPDGEYVQFRAAEVNQSFSESNKDYYNFKIDGEMKASGDIMSLLDNTTTSISVPANCFCSLFDRTFALTDASDLLLPATNLEHHCYYAMFMNCINLVAAPKLPAMNLAEFCYFDMFAGCVKLIAAPELPAIVLAEGCYLEMFRGCKTITTAPELPAMNLATSCYIRMFQQCTNLTTIPELPAISLAASCYSGMFIGCENLTTAPELSAEDLALGCYAGMFSGCSSLKDAPKLPSLKLADQCYWSMFKNCINLITTPNLPAMNLAQSCYGEMFFGCTNLKAAPELPATELQEGCYLHMFAKCTALEKSPKLHAKTLAEFCCTGMFYGCKRLNSIEMLATDVSAQDSLYDWLYDVSPTGTFVKSADAVWDESEVIPSGWTVKTASER